MTRTGKKLLSSLIWASGVLVGLIGGCVLSDYVALTGYPHTLYRVEVAHEPTARGAYECQRMSNAFGPELSFFNEERGVQDRCVLLVKGELLADGSMRWYPGHHTWYGRIVQDIQPVVIPAIRIKSVTVDH